MEEVKKNIVVIHHNDLDGFGSLAVIYKKFIKTYNIINIPFSYNNTLEQLINTLNLNNLEALFILDCNLSGEADVQYLNSIDGMFPNKIAFIDHHENSYNLQNDMKFDNVVNKSVCAAKLTLNKFFPTERNELYEYINTFDTFEFESIKQYNKSDLLNSLCNLVDKTTFIRQLAFSNSLDDLFNKFKHLLPIIKQEYKVILSDAFSPIIHETNNCIFYRLDFKKVNPLFYPNVNMIRLNKKDAPITVYFNKYKNNPITVKFSIRIDSTKTDININDILHTFDYLITSGGHKAAAGGSLKTKDIKQFIKDIKNIQL